VGRPRERRTAPLGRVTAESPPAPRPRAGGDAVPAPESPPKLRRPPHTRSRTCSG